MTSATKQANMQFTGPIHGIDQGYSHEKISNPVNGSRFDLNHVDNFSEQRIFGTNDRVGERHYTLD
jgi:hypothetical protein